MRQLPLILLMLASTPAFAAHTLESILAAHGLDHFDSVEEIRFTFVVERPDTRIARHWEWKPKTGDVTLSEQKDGALSLITWNRNTMDAQTPEEVIAADRRFINDSFWLLWPLHASWSPDAVIEQIDEETVRLAYAPQGGGYTPGDAYVIDLDDTGLATQWAFHKAGADQPGLTCTFQDYLPAGPLTLATDHQNDTGFRLLFENIAIRLTNDPRWKTASATP